MSRSAQSQPATPIPVTTAELRTLWVILLVATLLRGWGVLNGAIEHFDEGVYASNIWFDPAVSAGYPARHFYAPPLVPAILEAMAVAGLMLGIPLDGGWLLIPGAVAGCATVWSVWKIARWWLGPREGLAAALIMATSGLHIAYSATALTDPFVLLAMLWAIHWFGQSMVLHSLPYALLAGLATTCAWWCKYTGWLPVAVALAASGYVILRRWRLSDFPLASAALFAGVSLLGGAALIATLGGFEVYSAIAANHRQYLHGFKEWWPTLVTQSQHMAGFSRATDSWGILGAGWLLMYWRVNEPAPGNVAPQMWLYTLTILFQFSGLMLTGSPVAVVLMGVGLAVQLITVARQDPLRLWGAVLFSAWALGLLATIPLYYSYPRLMLPAHLALVLSILAFLSQLELWLHAQADPSTIPPPPSTSAATSPGPAGLQRPTGWSPSTMRRLELTMGLCCIIGIALPSSIQRPWLIEPRQGVRDAARAMAAKVSSQGEAGAVVYTLGDPALFFQLRAARQEIVAPLAELEGLLSQRPERPTYVTWSPQCLRSPALVVQLKRAMRLGQLAETVVSITVPLGNVTWRDQGTASSLVDGKYALYRLVGQQERRHEPGGGM